MEVTIIHMVMVVFITHMDMEDMDKEYLLDMGILTLITIGTIIIMVMDID
jgi:hypothetical protein